MTDRELLQQCYDALGRYEGIAAARAYTEMTSPPFERGARNAEWDRVRALLTLVAGEIKESDLKFAAERKRCADLLFALKTIMGDAEHGQRMTWQERCEIARAAIRDET